MESLRAVVDVLALAASVVPNLFEVGDSVGGLLGLPTGVDRDVIGQSDGGIGLDGAFLVGVPTGEGVALADGRGIIGVRGLAVAGIRVGSMLRLPASGARGATPV